MPKLGKESRDRAGFANSREGLLLKAKPSIKGAAGQPSLVSSIAGQGLCHGGLQVGNNN